MRKWLPLAPINAKYAWAFIRNMLPQRSGTYAPPNLFVQKVGAGPATPGTTLRAWCALLADDTAIGYIGTSTKLYVYDGTSTFTDRSLGGGYTATDWSFAQYGNITFAVDRVDSVQTRDATGVAAFANATGSPPKARIVVTQADQVLLFDLNDGAEKPNAFAACAPGDHTDWSGAGATTATQIRHRPGKITAAVAFKDYVLVFKRGSVYRLTYTGNNTFKWKVELIAIGRGAWGKHDVVNCGDIVVFSGPGGVWTFDGASFRSVSDYTGQISIADASLFLPGSQSVYFHRDDTYSAYNLVSDAWGSQTQYSTTAALASTYRPFTGDPAALNTFSSAAIGVTYPSVTWLVDLSLNPCVVTSTTVWGGGTPFASSDATLTGSFEGAGGEQITQFTRLDVVYAPTFAAVGNNTPPAATELKLDIYKSSSSMDFPTLAVANTDIASSTAQRRFDFNVASVYVLPYIKFPMDSGYVEVDDYQMTMKSAGKL